jgi:hypothetical protein
MKTDDADIPVALGRYRLRFLLQEFDLPSGETLIGRGAECHITIFDPSISRKHARIRIERLGAFFEDLGSRNGSRVNGNYVRELTQLRDGDRLRLGTQELVLSEVRATPHVNRQTGSLCFCATCKSAYPKEMQECPHCGCSMRGHPTSGGIEIDDDTTTPLGRVASVPPPAR